VTMNEIIERLTKSIERSERNPATWPRVVFEDAEVILDALKAGQALADAMRDIGDLTLYEIVERRAAFLGAYEETPGVTP
jgi:hypothetical protein